MAQSKEFFTRIQHKHDIEANWIKAVNFIPLNGEIIVYDKDSEHDSARIKIGDGTTKINELPFIQEASDIDAVTIDIDDAAEGTAIGVNADTFGGYPVNHFLRKDEIINADQLGGYTTEQFLRKDEDIDANTFGGQLPDYYAAKNDGNFTRAISVNNGTANSFHVGGGDSYVWLDNRNADGIVQNNIVLYPTHTIIGKPLVAQTFKSNMALNIPTDITTAPSANTYTSFNIKDNNDVRVFAIEAAHRTNGERDLKLYDPISNSTLMLKTDASGNTRTYVNNNGKYSSATQLRNIDVRTGSATGTLQATDRIIMVRK